jgi:PAS domain S-box-containing protein
MAPENSRLGQVLEDLPLLASLDKECPFGYWLADLDSDALHLNNTLRVALGQEGSSIESFKSRVLGKEQWQFCLAQMQEHNQVKLPLIYCNNHGIFQQEVELQRLEAYPQVMVAKHPFPASNPWGDKQRYYPYYLKINAAGEYVFYNQRYADMFLGGDLQARIGLDSTQDVAESSREDCILSASKALQNPKSIVSVRLDKILAQSRTRVSTQWQFVSLLDGSGRANFIYARGYDRTSLSQTERSLAERQREFDYFFNSEMIGVFFMMLPEPQDWNGQSDKWAIVDYALEHQRVTRCNQALLNQYGYQEEASFLNLRPKEMFPHNPEEGRRIWYEFFEKGHLHTLTEERRIDGSPVFIEGDYHLLKNEAGQIVGHFGMQQDVTAREKNKARYEASRQQLQYLTESIPGVVFQIEQSAGKAIIRFLSKGFEDLKLGVSREELQEDGDRLLELVSPKDYSTLLGSVLHAVRKRTALDSEFRVQSKLGEERWFRVSARPEKNDENYIQWYGILQPIDEQKDYEKEQEKLAQIARNTSDLMLLVDPEGRIEWLNRAALQFFGWTSSEALGALPADILECPEQEQLKESVFRAIAQQSSLEEKIKILGKEGERWVHFFVRPIWNTNGEYLYCLLSMQDIHEEELKNQEMEALLNLTADQNKRLQSFTYIVSHNIRSHSANLQGLLEAIESSDSEEEREELWTYLQQVSSGLESTIKHLNEIIAINRNLNKSKVQLSLQQELHKITAILSSEIQNLKARIVFDFPEDTKVLAVHAYLESVLLNLMSNALRYRHPDRIPEIHVSHRIKGEHHSIKVRDNGLGIDLKRHRKRLFQLYQTFHDHPESRGLGLYILKNQLEAMGGEVKVNSTLGEGTEFEILLPLEMD